MRYFALTLLVVVGCASTSFSNYQTARLLAPGKTSVAGAAGIASAHGEGSGWSGVFLGFEGLYRRGLSPSLEGGVRLSQLCECERDPGPDWATLLYVDAKYSLLPDELAVQLPVGIAWREDALHDLQLQPTLIHTMTMSPRLELDTAAKTMLILDDVSKDPFIHASLTVGLRIRSDWHRVELHPEVGFLLHDLRNGVFDSIVVGAGLAVIFSP